MAIANGVKQSKNIIEDGDCRGRSHSLAMTD